MKIEDIRARTDSELDYEMSQAKRELFDLRIKATTDSIPSPARITELRRTIARIRTIQHERATGIRGQQPR
jgi:large subunit ribosomal protein L29